MTTPNLGLTEVPSNVQQPYVAVNLALQAIDALVTPGSIVQDKDLTTPPTTVAGDAGKRWIIPSGATGVWSGKTGQIALCTAATLWKYFTPSEGWEAYVLDEDTTYRHNGTAWVIASGSTFTGGSLTSALNEAKGADIASATTTDIGAATGNLVHVTGTTTITALGTAQAGTRRIVRFAGALTLTHNATSLILPTAANITTAANDCAVFVSEGLGNWRCVAYTKASGAALVSGGGALTNFTESVNTSLPNTTVPVASLLATNAAANVDLALLPKGTGALIADIPDGGIPGGNKRGTQAIDWQMSRTVPGAVASGANSVICGGADNTASSSFSTVAGGTTNVSSGASSTVGGGNGNTASASYSCVPGGQSCTASGDHSLASGNSGNTRNVKGMRSHGAVASKQDGKLTLARQTTDATATVLTSDNGAPGATNQYTLPSNMATVLTGAIVARQSAGTGVGDVKTWEFKAALKNISGTTSLVAAVTPAVVAADTGASAWAVAVTADNTNKCLKVEVTGEASKTIQWTCHVFGPEA